ncbi:MAG: glycosyl hydrolase [Pseudomonadota bacterium]
MAGLFQQLSFLRRRSHRHFVIVLTATLLSFTRLILPVHADSHSDDHIVSAYEMLTWRNIGPDIGGRSIAASGSAQRPNEYYFGATGGGLWKTTDSGANWAPVTDGQIKSASIGAIAVDPKNPDTVYIGMGEGQLRNNVLQGDGVYKSIDGGRTWRNIGLSKTRTITTIRVHPKNTEIVYAAALGDPFAPNTERGVYRSKDGGESWRKILFRSEEAGAIDLSMDVNNPNVLYATIWQVYRKPWKLWSGGPQSGLFKSTDGGDTWTEITGNPGLPKTTLGKMTVAVSPADSNRVYANIEAEKGGLYRSDDAGRTWEHINGDRKLWQRSFYFLQVRPDPKDRDTLYVLSFRLEKSTDGGRTFAEIPTQHDDIHDLWIAPDNPRRMVVADDGGGSVSVNGGDTWTAEDYPTAQIYRLATTNDFPYHVCGSQQDYWAECVLSRPQTALPEMMRESFAPSYNVSFSEMGHIAPHPTKPGVFFTGATNELIRFDRSTGDYRDVQPYPYIVMGQSAGSMRERWSWNYPIVFSHHRPYALYVGSQHLWRSDDEGETWAKISPDLTRAEGETLGDTGGEILFDQDGPEIYATLYAVAPSPLEKSVIWTGSDDGLVHVTRNNGDDWTNVTPSDLPANSRVTSVAPSSQRKGVAYLSARRNEMGDRAVYLWKTKDYGATWERMGVAGLAAEDFVHVLRADYDRDGLLFIGTEHGVRVSFDEGETWRSLSQNLPDTPVTDMALKDDDLVIATHGRSLYLLEGLSTLRQVSTRRPDAALALFKPGRAVRQIIPAKIDFHLKNAADKVTIDIIDSYGVPVRTLVEAHAYAAGGHRETWDLRHDGATVFPGIILESQTPEIGPLALPGNYVVRVTADGVTQTTSIIVALDPRLKNVSMNDLKAQHTLALKARDAASRANETVLEIRTLKRRIEESASGADPSVLTEASSLIDALTTIEGELYQIKNSSPKDKIAYSVKLNDRLAGLLGFLTLSNAKPTASQYQVYDALSLELNELLAQLTSLKSGALSSFDRLLTENGLTPIATE